MRHNLYWIRQRTGSQCSCVRLGVIWSNVFKPKMSLAAAFFVRVAVVGLFPVKLPALNYSNQAEIWQMLAPVGLQLQCQHVDESVADDEDGNNMWLVAVVLLMCCFIDNSASRWTPRSRTTVNDWIVLEPTWSVRLSAFSFFRAAREPNQITLSCLDSAVDDEMRTMWQTKPKYLCMLTNHVKLLSRPK